MGVKVALIVGVEVDDALRAPQFVCEIRVRASKVSTLRHVQKMD